MVVTVFTEELMSTVLKLVKNDASQTIRQIAYLFDIFDFVRNYVDVYIFAKKYCSVKLYTHTRQIRVHIFFSTNGT